jgi:hypothetical protein
MSVRHLKGSCVCGQARYAVDLDPTADSYKCNCSVCGKHRTWFTTVAPSAFQLLVDDDALGHSGKRIVRRFCKQCGTHLFARATGSDGKPMVGVVLATVEGLSDEERAAMPVKVFDGRHDDFEHAPKITAYL